MIIGAVVLSVIAYMILGFLWYSPVLFGKPWTHWSGVSLTMMDKERMTIVFGLSGLGAFLEAWILSYLLAQYDVQNLNQALILSGMLGLGFSFTALLSNNLYQQKKIGLTCIDAGYQIAGALVMGAVLYFFL